MNKGFKLLFTGWSIASLMVLLLVLGVPQRVLGARSMFGLIGIYNATALNLSNGEGAALAVDSSGHLIMSTTTTVQVSFSSTAPTNIKYASSTVISILQSLFVGNTGIASTTINGSGTSTFNGSLLLTKTAGVGTSTFQIGSATSTNGGCIALGTGTTDFLYVFMINTGSHLEMVTSTKATDCY